MNPTTELVTLNFTDRGGSYRWIAIYAGDMLHTQGQHTDLELEYEIARAINSTGCGVTGARDLTFDSGSIGDKWFNELMENGDQLPAVISDIPEDVMASARVVTSPDDEDE